MGDLPTVAITIKDGKISKVDSDIALWYVIIDPDVKDFYIHAIDNPNKSLGEILFEGVTFSNSS